MGPYNETTRAYVDFLVATSAGGSIEEGLVVLWAMEQVIRLLSYDNPPLSSLLKHLSRLGDSRRVALTPGISRGVDPCQIPPALSATPFL